MKRIAKNVDVWRGLGCVFDQAAVSAASFLASTLLGRSAGPDALGIYYLALSFVLLARGVQEQLIAAPYTVYAQRRNGRELDEYTGSALVHQLLLAGLTSGGLTLLALIFWLQRDGAQWLSLGLTLAAVAPVLLLKEHLRLLALARLDLRGMILLDLAATGLQTGILLALFASGALSIPLAFAALGLAAGVACMVWWRAARLPFEFRMTRWRGDWRHNWKFGRWALLGFMLGSTAPQIIPWLLAGLYAEGAQATGLLAANLSLVGLTNIISTGLSNLLAPRATRTFAELGSGAMRRLLWQFAVAYFILLGSFCLFVAATGGWLVAFVYGPDFAGSGAVLLLLALTALINSLGLTAGNGLWAIEKPRANFAADACSLAGMLLTAAWLIPAGGATGAATAMLVGTSIGAVVRWLTLRHAMSTLAPAAAGGGAT